MAGFYTPGMYQIDPDGQVHTVLDTVLVECMPGSVEENQRKLSRQYMYEQYNFF